MNSHSETLESWPKPRSSLLVELQSFAYRSLTRVTTVGCLSTVSIYCIVCYFILSYFTLFMLERTLNIQSTLNKFLSVQRIVIDYWHNVAQQISRASSSSLNETLCLLVSNSPFVPLPSPGKPPFHFPSMNLTI